MQHKANRVTQIVSAAKTIDLKNSRSVFVKNIGDTDCNFGELKLRPGETHKIDAGNSTLNSHKVSISFDKIGSVYKLFVETVIYTDTDCN